MRVGRGVDGDEGAAAQRIWRRWQLTLHHDNPPPLVSDGFGGHREALLQVFGYAKRGGARRSPKPGWQYLQVIRLRDARKRVLGVRLKWVWGQPTPQLPPQTAYVERTHLTSRRMNARLARRGLAVSKSLNLLWASLYWCDALYNLVSPVKTLRQPSDQSGRRWTPRSPAMAAGLTDHLWSVRELLFTIPLITNSS